MLKTKINLTFKSSKLCVLLFLFLFIGCNSTDIIDPAEIKVDIYSELNLFAVIGDYGYKGKSEKKVADLVKSWNPDFILTTGDNNYNDGELSTINKNIGQYYANFIYNIDAPEKYQCEGAANNTKTNRFFPTPGNHDVNSISGLKPYLNYFTLPGNELNYHFIWGTVSFYSLNSTARNMDDQFLWLANELKSDSSIFKVVYFHHSPYSPGDHGNNKHTQWDYQANGVDVVIAGHDHIYARIEKKNEANVHYLINGLGGKSIHGINYNQLDSNQFSIFTYTQNYGAIKGTSSNNKLKLEFFSINNSDQCIDSIVIDK